MNRNDLREVIARAVCLKNERQPDETYGRVLGWVIYLPEADAILSALDAAGMVVRPKEPTSAMIDAGDSAWFSDDGSETIYRAMIAVEG